MYIKPFRPEEEQFIRENHKTMPVKQISKHLGRALVTIYDYMDKNNLEVFRLKSGKARKPRVQSKEFFDINERDTWL